MKHINVILIALITTFLCTTITLSQIETILLVDDDGGSDNGGIYTNVRSYYTDALNEAGYSYTIFIVPWTATPSNGPVASVMQEYDCVIWFTGETYGGGIPGRRDVLTTVDEYNLAAYLDDGGTLFLNAQDYLYDAYMSAGEFHQGQFPYDYLGVSRAVQDVFHPPNNVVGASGSFAVGLSYVISDPFPSATIWADSLAARQQKLLNVNNTQKACAVQFQQDDFHTVFSTCGVEGLVNGTNRVSDYLDAILTGFETGVTSTTEFVWISEYHLSQNFPNPFNPTTQINYQIPVTTHVAMTIFNTLGQYITTLVNRQQHPGTYHITWNAQNLPSGIYFYQLQTTNITFTRPMILLK